jgi:hypothetical protein
MKTFIKCLIDDCDKPSDVPGAARGWCRSHYRRWQRYGSATEPLRRKSSYSGQKCSAEDCNSAARAHGDCMRHYMQKVRQGGDETLCSHGACRKQVILDNYCGMHHPKTTRSGNDPNVKCANCESEQVIPRLRTNFGSRWFHFCTPVCRMQWRIENSLAYRGKTSARHLSAADRAAYGQACIICGESRALDLGHKDPARNGGGIEPGNMYVLCPTHHRILDQCPELFTERELVNLKTVDEVWATAHPSWGTSGGRQLSLF